MNADEARQTAESSQNGFDIDSWMDFINEMISDAAMKGNKITHFESGKLPGVAKDKILARLRANGFIVKCVVWSNKAVVVIRW